MLRHRSTRLFGLGVLLAGFMVGIAAQSASAVTFSCSNYNHDVVGADGTPDPPSDSIDGAMAEIYVPDFSTSNLYSQLATGADIAVVNSDAAAHFFQAGWYVGSTSSGLRNVASPYMFAGEGLLSTGAETLSTEVALTPGFHQISIYQESNSSSPHFRHWYATLDGSIVWTSSYTTTLTSTPRFIGETNYDCADMYALAESTSNGPSLELHHVGGSWSFWSEHYNFTSGTPVDDPSCWADNRIESQTATVFAYDLC